MWLKRFIIGKLLIEEMNFSLFGVFSIENENSKKKDNIVNNRVVSPSMIIFGIKATK